LARELGIPDDVQVQRWQIDANRYFIRGGEHAATWADYRFELFGEQMWEEPAADHPQSWVQHHGWILLWQELIFYRDSPVYGCIRWGTDRQQDLVSIHGLETAHDPAIVSTMHRALLNWRDVRRPGTRFGTGYLNDPEVLRNVMMSWLRDTKGKPPTQDSRAFAERLGYTTNGLPKALKTLRISHPSF